MKIVIYPGCMVLARFQDYEHASRVILEQLGYEIVNVKAFCCCGASLLPGVTDNWVNLCAYNLALAEESGADIVTLCGNCTSNFKRANIYLEKDPEIHDKTKSILDKLGLSYGYRVKVHHLMEVLYGRLEDIQKLVKRKLGFKVAITHPCQVLRPKEITGILDNHTQSQPLRRILESLNVEVIDYPEEYECCGATALLFDEKMAIDQGRAKLESARAHGADVICAACGNCLFLLDRYQNKMVQTNPDLKIPVISLSQLVGLAIGYSKRLLHIRDTEALDLE